MDQNIMMLWIVAWLSALGFAFWRLRWVESQSQGTDEIAKIDEIDAMKTLFSKNKRNTDDIFNSFSRILSEFIPI